MEYSFSTKLPVAECLSRLQSSLVPTLSLSLKSRFTGTVTGNDFHVRYIPSFNSSAGGMKHGNASTMRPTFYGTVQQAADKTIVSGTFGNSFFKIFKIITIVFSVAWILGIGYFLLTLGTPIDTSLLLEYIFVPPIILNLCLLSNYLIKRRGIRITLDFLKSTLELSQA